MYRTHSIFIAKTLNRILKNPKLGVEIGVASGKTSKTLLQRMPRLTLYLVDPWENQPYQKYMVYQTKKSYKAHFIKQREVALELTDFAKDRRIIVQDFSVNASKQFEDGFFDFVFIDADHRYKSVMKDMNSWFLKVREGGVFCGHDYGGRRSPGREEVQVRKAVDEFAAQYGYNVNSAFKFWWMIK